MNQRQFLQTTILATASVVTSFPRRAHAQTIDPEQLRRIDEAPTLKQEFLRHPIIIKSVELLRNKGNFLVRIRSKDGAQFAETQGVPVMSEKAQDLWKRFCDRMKIAADSVHLFDSDKTLRVGVREVGARSRRVLLKRSPEMEVMVIEAANQLEHDWRGDGDFDGLIYLMFHRDSDENIIPLYVGKTETLGKGAGNISANIENISSTNKGKFARWGDGYQYHIGDLSAVVLGHPDKYRTEKYKDWANALFTDFPVYPPELPKLRRPVYFWIKPWKKNNIGLWEGFGPTNLTFLEYLLIGAASSAYPETVLNKEGQNRRCDGV